MNTKSYLRTHTLFYNKYHLQMRLSLVSHAPIFEQTSRKVKNPKSTPKYPGF